jgi:hypothetical protein
MEDVATSFPGENDVRGGPVITWRTLHHPKRNSAFSSPFLLFFQKLTFSPSPDYTPYSRVAALDQLARKTMHELRVSSLATHPNFLSGVLASFRQTRERYFPREALDELKAATLDDKTDYGFDERVRINEIGKLLEGQEDHVRPIPPLFS